MPSEHYKGLSDKALTNADFDYQKAYTDLRESYKDLVERHEQSLSEFKLESITKTRELALCQSNADTLREKCDKCQKDLLSESEKASKFRYDSTKWRVIAYVSWILVIGALAAKLLFE